MNLYIAGKWTAQARLRVMRDRIQAVTPHRVISTWLDQEPTADRVVLRQHAYTDYLEVKQAYLLLLDTLVIDSSGGREVEWGIALGRGYVHRWRVGPERNIFHALAQRTFETWDPAIDALKGVCV